MDDKELQDTLERYRAGAEESSTSQATTDPDKANRGHDKMHEAYKLLKKTAEGREAISRLMYDADPEVRAAAAADSLEWKPDEARRVLEAIVQEGGLLGFEAEMTLKEYDKGRLSFDY